MSTSSLSKKVRGFPDSVIREMTILCEDSGAINLAQGSPEFPAPEEVKKTAAQAILEDQNQYTITWGIKELRDNLAEKLRKYNGIEANPEDEITVTCGSTEAIACSIISVVNPGDEVIITEPFYENYGPATLIADGRPKFTRLNPPSFGFNEEALKQTFSSKTKAIIINTPNNPTGKVFSIEDLKLISDLCSDYDVIAITDEVYEYLLYDNHVHTSLATVGDMHDRTITVSSFSKTYSVTGWRVGYATASKEISNMLRRVHEFITIAPPAPLQIGSVAALNLPNSYYEELKRISSLKRNMLFEMLDEVGFQSLKPEGAYYIWADFTQVKDMNDFEFAEYMIKNVGVAGVPGSSFYHDSTGNDRIRFTFPKKDETLRKVGQRLNVLK